MNVTVKSAEAQNCSAQENTGKDWALLEKAASTMFRVSAQERKYRFE